MSWRKMTIDGREYSYFIGDHGMSAIIRNHEGRKRKLTNEELLRFCEVDFHHRPWENHVEPQHIKDFIMASADW